MKLSLTQKVAWSLFQLVLMLIQEEIENPDDTFLDCLFGFLDLEGKLNPTSAGYFCKVVNSLLGKRASDVIHSHC